MICVSVTGGAADFIEAQKVADIVELRLDLMGDCDFGKIAALRKKPLIITCRPKSHGGKYSGDESQRFAFLARAAKLLHPDFIDVEFGTGDRFIRSLPAKGLILSYHDFEKTPDNLERIYRKMASSGAQIVKIATMASSIQDNLQAFEILSLSRKDSIKSAVFCMGPLGMLSRILYRKFGGCMTYASLALGKESAPGQLTASELRQQYRANSISPGTRLFGVLGSPERHTSSPLMFNAAYRSQSFDAIHVKFPVTDLAAFIKNFKSIVDGFAVTIPHKEAVIPFLDELDSTASAIGAVNTVVNNGGRLKGYNTDVTGGMQALQGKTTIRGRKVVILGAGGASRAMAHGVVKAGGKLTVLNRTLLRARRLAEMHGCAFGFLSDLKRTSYDILINCTSLGMNGELPVNELRPGSVVMDMVYSGSGETRLIELARASGCATITGRDVLLLQALGQYEMWTGKKAPLEIMREALKNA